MIIGSDRKIRLPCSDADNRHAQLVAQESQEIEELPAAVALPGEDIVQLVDDKKRQLEGQVLDRVFEDTASGRDTARPQLTELLRFARDGDTVVVHSMDRLARNLDDLRALVQGLTRKGVRVEFVKESLVFTGEDSSMANLMLSVMGAFAEFERSLIRERQREGIALAQQRGAYKGRKKTLTPERAAELVTRAGSGVPKAVLPRDRETVYQYLRQAKLG